MSNFINRLIGKLDTEENRAGLKENIAIKFPSELANPFFDYVLERSYLEDISERNEFAAFENGGQIGWLRINRLPIHPNVSEQYDLLARWQSVLASFHTWNDKLLFLLQRVKGYTNIYIGVNSENERESVSRWKTALTNCMPGIVIDDLNVDEKLSIFNELIRYKDAGAITGIPSFRKETQYNVLQTLDQLAFGIRDAGGNEVDFSLLVVAEPMNDAKISETISKFQQLGSEIHSEVKRNITETDGTSSSRATDIGIGTLLSNIGCVLPHAAFLQMLYGGVASQSRSKTISYSKSVGSEYLNKFAQYSEKVTDMHCERLRNGRNLGFWNTGIYVLGPLEKYVTTVLGMLRSVYSGDKSYIEPIRVHSFSQKSNAIDIIKRCQLIPLIKPEIAGEGSEEWNVLGEPYQYLSTPLNTEELSLITSLPRKDVPGLRFVKSAVRFANNPGENIAGNNNAIVLGKIKDTGIVQKNDYSIDLNSLVRHSLIAGGTGCGKTTTCKTIINAALEKKIPVLIIEPAKDEYVRWAISQKKAGADINIFMPGVKTFEGERIEQLKLNPFQPAAIEGAPVDMMTRCEQLTALVNASLPASDVLPVIIDEAFFSYLKEQPFGDEFLLGEMKQQPNYPKLDGILDTAKKLLKFRGYSQEVTSGLSAALETRFAYLVRGKRGEILNVFNSTPWDKLFNKPVVINLSKIANSKDRALIMSILMLALYEYRISAYTHDKKYREKAQENRLLHLTVIEEAHNVLSKPSADFQGTGNPQQAVADLFGNMLSEIRSYGEGLMIVDQVPTKLIPDVIKNTNYKIVHRMTSPDDFKLMASALALRKDQEDIIPTLSQGDIVISGDKDDAALWVKVNKPEINL
jgi:DNA helicase HerA-like ATPase